MVSVLPNGKFLLFLSLFGTLSIKAMAFWEISISSQQKSAIFLNVSKGLHKYFNTILFSTPKQMLNWVSLGGKITRIYAKMPCQ